MNILQEALTALLSGLTTKTGNEIHWKDEYGEPITIEPIDIGQNRYIIRHYWENGNRNYEIEYQDRQEYDGFGWHNNGIEWYKIWYQNGQRHIKWFKKKYYNHQRI